MNHTILFLTTNYTSTICNVIDLYKSLEDNSVSVSIPEELKNEEVKNLIIVDLDSYIGENVEEFKELLERKASRIILVCTKDFQRLLNYGGFTCYVSWENLVQREFFLKS